MNQAESLYFLLPFLILGAAHGILDFTGQINIEKIELCKGYPNPNEAKFALKENPRHAVVTVNIKNDIDSVAKGKYSIEKLQFSSNEFRMPLSWMGKYRATLTIKNKSEDIFCLYGEANLTK